MATPYVVLVTGGNNGIGYEACKAFYESPKSYIVLMGSRSLEKGEAAIKKIKEEVPNSSNTLELIQLDVTSDESIQKAYEQIIKSPGRLDALVNNAGIYSPLLVFGQCRVANGQKEQLLTSTTMPAKLPSASASTKPTTLT
jgi:NAD(P)-dependent dehydrogenase (short-subunit alcohol dehydrogenase family)